MAAAKLFTRQTAEYLQYRPTYPSELYEYLSSLTPEHKFALDVATGSGQAAVGLAKLFTRVVATDANADQIAKAIRLPNVDYRVCQAEMSEEDLKANSLVDSSFDLITVASGAHWLDHSQFHPVVKRLLKKPQGIYATWGTERPQFNCPLLDETLAEYYQVIGKHSAPQLKLSEAKYLSIPFPFEEIFHPPDSTNRPTFRMELNWTFEQFIGRLSSSSRVQTSSDRLGKSPLEEFKSKFRQVWGDQPCRTVSVGIFMRVGRVGLNNCTED